MAALAINLSLLFILLFCLRLFNCCIRWSTVVQDFYQGGFSFYDDVEVPEASRGDGRKEYSRGVVNNRLDSLLAASRRIWLPATASSWLAILCLAVDASALSAFSFAAETPISSNAETLSWGEFLVFIIHRISQVVMLDSSLIPYQPVFYACCTVAFLSAPLGIYILAKDKRDNSIPQILFQIIANLLLFPIACALFSILACEYHSDGPPTLPKWDNMVCWHDTHAGLVVLGLSALVIYYLTAIMVMARVVRSVIDEAELVAREGPNALYFQPQFTVWYYQLRIVASFLVTYWAGGQYPRGIVASGVGVMILIMISYNHVSRPCNADVYNTMRTYSLFLPLSIDICALCSLILPAWKTIGQWILLAAGGIWVISVVYHYSSEYACTFCISPDDYNSDLHEVTVVGVSSTGTRHNLSGTRSRPSEPLPGSVSDSFAHTMTGGAVSTRNRSDSDAGDYYNGYRGRSSSTAASVAGSNATMVPGTNKSRASAISITSHTKTVKNSPRHGDDGTTGGSGVVGSVSTHRRQGSVSGGAGSSSWKASSIGDEGKMPLLKMPKDSQNKQAHSSRRRLSSGRRLSSAGEGRGRSSSSAECHPRSDSPDLVRDDESFVTPPQTSSIAEDMPPTLVIDEDKLPVKQANVNGAVVKYKDLG